MMTHLFIKYRMVTEATFHERHSINKIKIANCKCCEWKRCKLQFIMFLWCTLRPALSLFADKYIDNNKCGAHTHTYALRILMRVANERKFFAQFQLDNSQNSRSVFITFAVSSPYSHSHVWCYCARQSLFARASCTIPMFGEDISMWTTYTNETPKHAR